MNETLVHELLPSARDKRMYALLDAARDERIYPALLRADCEWSCLYRGDAAATMAEVAPYLVELDRASRFANWVLDQGWGNSWGVFVIAPTAMEALRNHFRRFLMVRLPAERLVYFRFYDPRVLRVYLPTCTPEELELIFGPVDYFVMESGETRGELIVFPRGGAEQRIAC